MTQGRIQLKMIKVIREERDEIEEKGKRELKQIITNYHGMSTIFEKMSKKGIWIGEQESAINCA